MFNLFNKINYFINRVFLVIISYQNFLTWFLDRLHILPRKKILYKLHNGTKFLAESGTFDCQFISEMFIDKQYTINPGFEISPTDIIVDCGSHKGFFTIFAAKTASQGKVISYEASPETYEYLVENLKINNIENVEHFNMAVGLLDGKVNFYLANDPGCNMIVPKSDFHEESDSKGIITVPQVGFETMINQLTEVDLLKMDIEGVEFEILMNCSSPCLNKIKRIAMEYHPEFGNIDALMKHLENFGFKTLSWQKRRLLYAWR